MPYCQKCNISSLLIFKQDKRRVMMYEVQLFQKENLGQVRILGDKKNPLFCLKSDAIIFKKTQKM